MICLLVGLLTISTMAVSVLTGDQSVMIVNAASVSEQEASVEGTTEEAMEQEYERLEAEEAELKEMLREKESALDGEDAEGQIEVMELQEAVRNVQVQKMVLRARMEQ